MTKFIIRRLLAAIPILFGLLLVTFTLVRLVPGGPFNFVAGKTMPKELVAALEERYGLNLPLFLNLPNDGFLPDTGQTMKISPIKLPNCDKLEQGLTGVKALSTDQPAAVQGWQLLYWFEEHTNTVMTISIGGKDRTVECDRVRTTLYSDLTRSQFFGYLDNLLRFDFGPSLAQATRGQNVGDIIARRLPVSAKLGILSVIVGFLFGIPIGIIAALAHNKPVDRSISFISILGISVPSFVLGPGLILLFAVQLHWLPAPRPQPWISPTPFSPDSLVYAILPVFSLSVGLVTGIARLIRASLLDVLDNDYMRTARSKGLRERRVIYVHALRNALIPVATILGPLLAGTLTGTLFIEQVFAIPGLGSEFVDAVNTRDYNMLLGVTLLYGVFLVLGNILVDLMYTWLDPRIRFD